jgi:cytoskeletal protein RodZ
VYDPHSDEEGFFGWAGERIERLGLIGMADSRGGEECSETHAPEDGAEQNDESQPELSGKFPEQRKSSMRWIVTLLSHLLALVLGLLIAWYIFPRVLAIPVDPQTGKPLLDLPTELSPNAAPSAPAATTPGTNNPQSTGSAPSDSSHQADKGSKGEHAQRK